MGCFFVKGVKFEIFLFLLVCLLVSCFIALILTYHAEIFHAFKVFLLFLRTYFELLPLFLQKVIGIFILIVSFVFLLGVGIANLFNVGGRGFFD